MERLKKNMRPLICMLMILTMLFASLPTQEVQAAQKNGLVYSKTSGKYYYYKNGKKVKNAWKKVGSNKYYFNKYGTAYAAEKITSFKYNIVIKKINGKYYGFDNKGRMVKGLYCTMDQKLYYFNTKTGVYSSETTKKYRKACVYGKSAAQIRKLLGKPKKIIKAEGCYGPNGLDYIIRYQRYELTVFHNNKTGKEVYLGIIPL